MPYCVKQYRDTKELNLISTTALDSTGHFYLQLTWKQFEYLTALSFVPSAPPASSDNQQQDERYVVILTSADSSNPYKLYSSKHKNKAEEALHCIQNILKQLTKVPLSQDLLTLLILPTPKPLDDLPYVLSQYAIKISPVSREWHSLAHLIVNEYPLAYCMCELTNMATLKGLHEARVNLAVTHPTTGATLVHLAAQISDETLREVIDYLHSILSRDKYHEYINKPCDDESFMTSSRRVVLKRISSWSLSIVSEETFLSVDKILRRTSSPIDPPTTSCKLKTLTPLMVAVRKNCVRSVNYLLVVGANSNYQDPETGLTALHIAAIQSNVSIAKLLLCFDAELKVVDKEGRTPLDIAKKNEALDCIEVMETIDTLRTKRDFMRQQRSNERKRDIQTDSISLLSIDGGGTRGSICSFALYYIEKIMRTTSADPNLQIRQYFNWYSGTSIGAFFVLCMSHNQQDTMDVMSAIVNNRIHALAGKRVYDGPKQETLARKYIGDHSIRDVTNPKVLITTTRADQDPPRLVHITNYREDPGDGRDWKAWQAARASGAAPLFFPSFDQKYVDGGILATNPTQHALHDIHVYDGRKVGLVLSLGTGLCKPLANDFIDLVKPRLTHLVSDLRRDLKFFKSLQCMLTANIINSEDAVLHSKCWCESQGGVFHRLSPPLTQRYELDEKSDEGFVLFFYETYLYLLDIDDQISEISEQLLEHGTQWETTNRSKFKSTWV